MKCPECKAEMRERSFEGHGTGAVLVDVCHTCRGLWFDTNEIRQLSAIGTLRLFRELQGPRAGRHTPRAGAHSCPRCDAKLKPVHNMVHNQRYQASHCPQRHGHFISFFHFLREKGLARDLRPEELVALRQDVDALLCSDCGEPVRLASLSACARCQAPLSLLDPKCVEDTVRDAQRAAGSRQDVTPALAAQLVMDRLKLENFHGRAQPQTPPPLRIPLSTPMPSTLLPERTLGTMIDLLDGGLTLAGGLLELLGLL